MSQQSQQHNSHNNNSHSSQSEHQHNSPHSRDENAQNSQHWADQTADAVIERTKDQSTITCASGITPSGVVHIGNFREIITTELIVRALRRKIKSQKTNKQVRFIYSWDDYDVFRKVPKNMPKQEELKQFLRKPIVDVPDPFGTEESYARHFEVAIENMLPKMGIAPEFIYQSKKYRACTYAEGMRIALEKKDKIKQILDDFRAEELTTDFMPIRIFCEKCNLDTVETIEYKGEYTIYYKCANTDCNHEDTFDFRKKGIAKLQWRVDWPMRWAHERVDFEPGGKDHSSAGGSFDTGKEIVKEIYGWHAPHYIMYDFIRIKGGSGKISSSSGDVITVDDALNVYEPQMIRWLFATNRVGSEFAISFDGDVIKLYEDFDRCERIYYDTEKAKSDKDTIQQKRVYELSSIDEENIPMAIPQQFGFRHITTILQVNAMDEEKTYQFFVKENDKLTPLAQQRIRTRIACAANWLRDFAPEEYRFLVQESTNEKVPAAIVPAVNNLIALLENGDDADAIGTATYQFCIDNKIEPKAFFESCYKIIINKTKGPKLIQFILAIGKEKVIKILQSSI